MTEPIVIVGSRLQALIFWVCAAALGVGSWDRLGWVVLPIVAALAVWGTVVVVRRAELGADDVVVRRITGTRQASSGSFDADAGHRYLTIRFSDGGVARIEVPVEIRPEVRSWAEEH